MWNKHKNKKSCFKLISCGEINKNIIFPIIGGIFNFIAIICETNSKFESYPIILSIASTSGMSLSFILLLIYNFKNKNHDNINKIVEDTEGLTKFKSEMETKYKNIKKNKFWFILLLSILNFVITILFFYVCIEVQINLWYFYVYFLFSFLK